MTSIICETCRAKVPRFQSEINKAAKHYCSVKCKGAALKGTPGRNWKGGVMMHKGYILAWAPDHPANVKGYVPQHRIVMEKKIGRYLSSSEVVHHRNHVRDDNKVRNLELMTTAEHARSHAFDKRGGWSSPVWIKYQGDKIHYADALLILGVARCNFFRMRKRHGWTHQKTFGHYLKRIA